MLPGTVKFEWRNFLADDYLEDEARGVAMARYLSDGLRRTLREDGGREPLLDSDAIGLLGGDPVRARALADALLASARKDMVKDAGYDTKTLEGVVDQGVLPRELRAPYDAIVVVGGRLKQETTHEFYRRWEITLGRNILAIPLLIPVIIPFTLPIGLSILLSGFRGVTFPTTPNTSYVQLAVFDAKTGKLLFANDWYDGDAIEDPIDAAKVAKELLEDMLRIQEPPDEPSRGSEPAPRIP